MLKLSLLPKRSICCMLAMSIVFMPGCSLFVPRQQSVQINATDPQAEIFVDGMSRGTGSVSVLLDRTKSHSVTAKAPGGRSGAAAINKKISTTGTLDIIGGIFFLVPFLGLIGPGFWELDPSNVIVNVQ